MVPQFLEKFGSWKIGTVRFFSGLGTEELRFRFGSDYNRWNRTSKMHQKIAYLITNFDNISPYLKENNVQWTECTTNYKEFKGKQATITTNSVIHTPNKL